jgi:hypothetical protein
MKRWKQGLRDGLQRRLVTLLVTLTFAVLAASGVLAFVGAFSIEIVGLHALMGFVFIVLVGIHLVNNREPLKNCLHGKAVWVSIAITTALTSVILLWYARKPLLDRVVCDAHGRTGVGEGDLSHQCSTEVIPERTAYFVSSAMLWRSSFAMVR